MPDSPFAPDSHGAAALAYAEKGWRVFPVHNAAWTDRPCAKPGKAPLIKSWQTEASADAATIKKWWLKRPTANVAIAAGPSNLLIVDCDGAAGVEAFARWCDAHGVSLDNVPCVDTPRGGRHYYWLAPAGVVLGPRVGVLESVDVRAGLSYVVAPPSVGEGGLWTWRLSPFDDGVVVTLAPAAVVDLAGRGRAAGETVPRAGKAPLPAVSEYEGAPASYYEILGELSRVEEPGRNDALNRKAFAVGKHVVAAGRVSREVAERDLAAVAARMRGDAPLDPREVAATIKSGLDDGVAAGDAAHPAADDEISNSDLGNAERLVARHGADIYYCHPRKTWYVWDGRRWEADDTAAVERRAHETVRSIYAEASALESKAARVALSKWARQSEAHVRIVAMVAEARNIAHVRPKSFDADPWLFNCLNGVVDLRTGELLPHERHYLMTKCAPVEYDPAAASDVWDEFLLTSTQGDDEIKKFLARAVGYSLTGITSEEKFFFLHGPPATGKSTFVDAVKATMGEYCRTADFDTLVVRHFSGGVRDDIARLFDSRLVTAVEVDEGKKLAEGLVASITGGDTVTARELYSKAVECRPQFKLWIAANNEPVIHGNDSPIWRRVVRIPFEHVVPEDERDGRVKALFRDDLAARSAVLAWAVRGCLEWRKIGLTVPDALKAATAQYRDNQNVLAEFVEECCVVGANYRVNRDDLYKAYDDWCEKHTIRLKERLTRTTFVKRISPQYPLSLSSGRRIFNGLGLKSEYSTQQQMPI